MLISNTLSASKIIGEILNTAKATMKPMITNTAIVTQRCVQTRSMRPTVTAPMSESSSSPPPPLPIPP
ncbi:MAG: hypothetical protein BWY92_01110 [Firmicutes bacterium ADurb.BinA052]|nr:MAG: hypothetical protein BWY92_01110 [Firmicutes bacterium ADurb.BinA052]